MSTICQIMNINRDFSERQSQRIFQKNTKTQVKLKPKFLESRGQTFVENAMILTCAKIQRKMMIFGEIGTPEKYFWD